MSKLGQKGFTLVEGLLAVIAVVLIIGVGFYVVNASNTYEPADTVAAPVTKAQAQEVTAKPTFDTEKASHIENFNKASASFKAFLTGEAYEKVDTNCLDPSSKYYIGVNKMVRDDFAKIQYCTSGASQIYAKTDNGWEFAAGMGMGAPDCPSVDKYRISKEISTTCLVDGDINTPSTSRPVTYP